MRHLRIYDDGMALKGLNAMSKRQLERKGGRSHSVLIYDPSVEGVQQLLEGLDASCTTLPVTAAVELEPLLTEAVSTTYARAVHLLGHGFPGGITLGEQAVDAEAWKKFFGETNSLGKSEAAQIQNQQINFWSCKTGEGELGMDFINTVAQTTGATVNASTGYVGSSKRGASWDLDVTAKPAPPFSAAALEAFEGVLAAPVVTQGQLSVTYQGELQALRIGDRITLTFTADANDDPAGLTVEFDVSGLTGAPGPQLLPADDDNSPGVFSLVFEVPEDGLSFDSARVGVVVTNSDGSTPLTLSESFLVDSERPSIASIERAGGEYVTDAADTSVDFVVTFSEPVSGVTPELFAFKYGQGTAQPVQSVAPIAESGGTAP